MQFVFDDLQYLLISLARGLKYFNDLELHCPLDVFQTNWIFNRETKKDKHHFYCVGHTLKVMFLFCVFSIKDPISLKLVRWAK